MDYTYIGIGIAVIIVIGIIIYTMTKKDKKSKESNKTIDKIEGIWGSNNSIILIERISEDEVMFTKANGDGKSIRFKFANEKFQSLGSESWIRDGETLKPKIEEKDQNITIKYIKEKVEITDKGSKQLFNRIDVHWEDSKEFDKNLLKFNGIFTFKEGPNLEIIVINDKIISVDRKLYKMDIDNNNIYYVDSNNNKIKIGLKDNNILVNDMEGARKMQ